MASHAKLDQDPTLEPDRLFVHALREARFILSLWACCFLYTVTYCYLFGYKSHEPLPQATPVGVGEVLGPLESFNRDPASLTFPLSLGIPDWVFFGVVLPWVVGGLLTFWYAGFLFVEDDLSSKDDEKNDLKTGGHA